MSKLIIDFQVFILLSEPGQFTIFSASPLNVPKYSSILSSKEDCA
jgi:hypothetical protein